LGDKRGCFKTGCLGCLGTGGAVLLIVVVLLGLGLATGGRETRMVPIERTQTVPAASRTGSVTGEPLDLERPSLLDHEIEVAEPGRLVLDLHKGSFEIVPGPPGHSIRIEGRYDEGRFDLEETYETYGETGWIYRVSIDQRGFGLRPYVQHDGNKNRVRIIVPADMPLVLEGRVGVGESELELGGLWLLEVDLEIGVGDHTVSFDEPLPIPMGRLKLDTSIGALSVKNVGNASPHDVWIKHTIGETHIDLDGAWRRDAEALISCGIGQCDVRLPRDVNVELESARVAIGETRHPRERSAPPEGAPTLKLSVSGSIGEVSVR